MTKKEATDILAAAKVGLEPTKGGELTAEQLELMAEGIQSRTTIAELNQRLAAAESTSGSGESAKPRFKVDGDTYQLVIRESVIRLDGEKHRINAETLKADKKLLAHLVKIGAGCLRKVEHKKS